MKIHISQTVFNLQSRHEYMVEMAMFNIKMAIIPKAGNQSYGLCVLLVVLWCFTFM